ncbi:MAG: DUF4330 family protein [Ruminococcaceae bacterium]|nr:DUF4330 family protein [Oscillospiraceae bacterium]
MKQIQNDKKQRLVWVDWILLLFLAAVGILGAVFWHMRRQSDSPNQPMEYLLCVEKVDSAFYGLPQDASFPIKPGATVRNENATALMGRVVEVAFVPHRVPSIKNGDVVLTDLTGYYDLYITVEAEATAKAGDGMRVSDIRIAAGGRGDFRVGGFYAQNVTVVWVDRRDAQ